jgi:hypothetical protein
MLSCLLRADEVIRCWAGFVDVRSQLGLDRELTPVEKRQSPWSHAANTTEQDTRIRLRFVADAGGDANPT